MKANQNYPKFAFGDYGAKQRNSVQMSEVKWVSIW